MSTWPCAHQDGCLCDRVPIRMGVYVTVCPLGWVSTWPCAHQDGCLCDRVPIRMGVYVTMCPSGKVYSWISCHPSYQHAEHLRRRDLNPYSPKACRDEGQEDEEKHSVSRWRLWKGNKYLSFVWLQWLIVKKETTGPVTNTVTVTVIIILPHTFSIALFTRYTHKIK